jgi:hypothetical protein
MRLRYGKVCLGALLLVSLLGLTGCPLIPNQPPIVLIIAPGLFTEFTVGESITFIGEVVDLEDIRLPGDSLVWRSSINDEFGRGISFTYAGLSAGEHTITLTATDSGGRRGTHSIVITIKPR